MEVTGWTHFDNTDYIDLSEEISKLKLDTDKIKELRDINFQCYKIIIAHCIKNKIYVSDGLHQNGDFGVPIVDGKYRFECTLRYWSGIMAEVWSIINQKDYSYRDFYCVDYKDNPVVYNGTVDGTKYNNSKGIKGKSKYGVH